MTDAKTIANIILDEGGDNELTIYTTSVNRIHAKLLQSETVPSDTSNWGSEPETTMILDLQRVEMKLAINGWIDADDETKLINIFKHGGVFNLLWNGTTETVNSDQMSILDNQLDESPQKQVTMSVIIGENMIGE